MKGLKGRRRLAAALVVVAGLVLGAWPYSAYPWCGWSTPAASGAPLRVGVYEEFPTPERLAKLAQVDFPIDLALAAESPAAFEALRAPLADNPYVQTIYYWPTLTPEEGYYLGPWSRSAGLQRVMAETPAETPVLWDWEFPRGGQGWAVGEAPANRRLIEAWWAGRTAPVAVWRSFTFLGLDSPLLRLTGLYVDPRAYPTLTLHLDFYASGAGRPAWLTARMLRCGVERYGARFVPSFGVLDDGLGAGPFVSPEALARDVALARAAGVSEVWLFGLNGLNADYLAALRGN